MVFPGPKLDESTHSADSTLARALAPEDIRPGDYIALLHEIYELPSFYWCADAALMPVERPVRIRYVPHEDQVPLRVMHVCLPFVLVDSPQGTCRTIDLRLRQLARLDRAFAKAAWKAYKRKPRHRAKCRN
jgi:hypothetical protein